MIRPEALATLRRWQEVALGGAGMALGLWLFTRGGWILMPLGVGIAALALGYAVLSLRRMRFAQGAGAPGVVEVDEGQISYFGPVAGGAVSLR